MKKFAKFKKKYRYIHKYLLHAYLFAVLIFFIISPVDKLKDFNCYKKLLNIFLQLTFVCYKLINTSLIVS